MDRMGHCGHRMGSAARPGGCRKLETTARGGQFIRAFRRRSQRGNALVEAVIILPVLMLITFGGIELGIGFGQKGALESATRAGARKAATLTNDDDMGAQTVAAVNAALDST